MILYFVYIFQLIKINKSDNYRINYQSFLSCFQTVLDPSLFKTIISNLSPVYISLYAAALNAF